MKDKWREDTISQGVLPYLGLSLGRFSVTVNQRESFVLLIQHQFVYAMPL